MNRRTFFRHSAILAAAMPWLARAQSAAAPDSRIQLETTDARLGAVYTQALDTLARNVTTVSGYASPVLIEDSNYSGIWMECGPQEGLVYADVRPDVARHNCATPPGRLSCF
jgi:hypothetical protein